LLLHDNQALSLGLGFLGSTQLQILCGSCGPRILP
jgi:hypothetical protein